MVNRLLKLFFFLIYSLCYSQIDIINTTTDYIEVDSLGQYAYISLNKDKNSIVLSGSVHSEPQNLSVSNDLGLNWTNLASFENQSEGVIDQIDFIRAYFISDDSLVIFSNDNKYLIYSFENNYLDTFFLNPNKKGISYSFTIFEIRRSNREFYIFQKSLGGSKYYDNSTIIKLDFNYGTTEVNELDMLKFAQLTDERNPEKYRSPNVDDYFFTEDNCFYITGVMRLLNNDGIVEQKKGLIKIDGNESLEWQKSPFYFSDSTAEHFLFFDDCQNGFLSTYRTYRKEYPRIYKTTDGGDSWEKIFEDNENKFVLSDFKRADDSTLYATSADINIYRSTNNGETWLRLEHSLIYKFTDYTIFDKNTILVAYNKSSIAKITIEESKSRVVENYSILKISPPYPQPAHSNVTVELDNPNYAIEESSVAIYDFLGRKLESQEVEISKNSIRWDCSSVMSGIYLINIKHGTNEKAVKVVVE
jgi:type IX secretion system substrate protein